MPQTEGALPGSMGRIMRGNMQSILGLRKTYYGMFSRGTKRSGKRGIKVLWGGTKNGKTGQKG